MENKTNEIWKRPQNVPFPSVWYRFEGENEINGVIPQFWVQDTPEEEFDNIVDIMITRFMHDEPITSCSKIFEEEESMQYMRKLWKECLEQKLTICCYMENPDDSQKPILAGLNCTYVASKPQHEEKFDNLGKGAYSILYLMHYVQNKIKNPFEELKMDHLLNGFGLYVLPEFRGQALGKKIIEAREPLCKAIGIPASITVFTSPISQKLAERAGYKVLSEISYSDMMKIDPKVRFYDIEQISKSSKCMYKIF